MGQQRPSQMSCAVWKGSSWWERFSQKVNVSRISSLDDEPFSAMCRDHHRDPPDPLDVVRIKFGCFRNNHDGFRGRHGTIKLDFNGIASRRGGGVGFHSGCCVVGPSQGVADVVWPVARRCTDRADPAVGAAWRWGVHILPAGGKDQI